MFDNNGFLFTLIIKLHEKTELKQYFNGYLKYIVSNL